MIGTNWKTTLLGICTILGAIIKAAMDMLSGQPVDYTLIIGGITAGMGLIAAKDAGVTGTAK